MVRLNDHPDMTIDVYRRRKITIQHISKNIMTDFLSVRCWFFFFIFQFLLSHLLVSLSKFFWELKIYFEIPVV